jgi:hypothetical protein
MDPVDGGIGSINPVYHLGSFAQAFLLVEFFVIYMCRIEGHIPDVGNKQAYVRDTFLIEMGQDMLPGDD